MQQCMVEVRFFHHKKRKIPSGGFFLGGLWGPVPLNNPKQTRSPTYCCHMLYIFFILCMLVCIVVNFPEVILVNTMIVV